MRVAVIGVGVMGRNHARVYHEMLATELVAVSDQAEDLAAAVARHHGARAYVDHRDLLDREAPDAVSVAVPTAEHHRVVLDALASGCHVLVEKPIASTVEEGREMIEAARRRGKILTVGHIERFNPAIVEMKAKIDNQQLGRVFQAHARRLGPFPARIRDVGVVVDLATHDLDVMRYLAESDVVRVYAETKREVHTSNEDLLTGVIRFENEMLGLLEINWLTPTKIREIYVTGERGMFRADYLTQDLFFFENANATGMSWDALSVLRGVTEGLMVRYPVQKKEPLRVELEAFVGAASGAEIPLVTGDDALMALDLALAMIRSGVEKRVIEFAQ